MTTMSIESTTFENMIGRTMASVTGAVGDEQMVFTATDGSVFTFYHYQDCCESVSIEDVAGDLVDLVGAPLVQAEDASNEPDSSGYKYANDSHTWTFYKFATVKGSVTVRWLGTSNGYYSESVTFKECLTTAEPPHA